MQAKKKRLTLELDLPVQRRLKAVAALKGVSMRRYCLAAIDRELARDESAPAVPAGRFSFAILEATRDKLLGHRVFAGDSAEFIREARKSRDTS